MAVLARVLRCFAVPFQLPVLSGVLRCCVVRTTRLCLEGELAEPAAIPALDEAILHFHYKLFNKFQLTHHPFEDLQLPQGQLSVRVFE